MIYSTKLQREIGRLHRARMATALICVVGSVVGLIWWAGATLARCMPGI